MSDVRIRTRPAQPSPHSVGVYERGFAGLASPWGTPTEQRPGFLGRMERSGTRWLAWSWSGTAYRFLGDFSDTRAANDALIAARPVKTVGTHKQWRKK